MPPGHFRTLKANHPLDEAKIVLRTGGTVERAIKPFVPLVAVVTDA